MLAGLSLIFSGLDLVLASYPSERRARLVDESLAGSPWASPSSTSYSALLAMSSESLNFRKSFHSLGSWYEEQSPELGIPGIITTTTSNEQ